jgi:hypothetical protein
MNGEKIVWNKEVLLTVTGSRVRLVYKFAKEANISWMIAKSQKYAKFIFFLVLFLVPLTLSILS